MTDFYQTLGVPRDATAAQLKAAYRALCKTMHPDKGGDTEAFRELQEAWECLSDPEQRAAYDRGEWHGSKRSRAVELLSRLFSTLADKIEVFDETLDLRKFAVEALQDAVKACARASCEAGAKEKALRATAARFTCKAGVENLPAAILERKADGLAQLKVSKEREETTLREALKMLDDYSYKVDAPKQGRSSGMQSIFQEAWDARSGIFSSR